MFWAAPSSRRPGRGSWPWPSAAGAPGRCAPGSSPRRSAVRAMSWAQLVGSTMGGRPSWLRPLAIACSVAATHTNESSYWVPEQLWRKSGWGAMLAGRTPAAVTSCRRERPVASARAGASRRRRYGGGPVARRAGRERVVEGSRAPCGAGVRRRAGATDRRGHEAAPAASAPSGRRGMEDDQDQHDRPRRRRAESRSGASSGPCAPCRLSCRRWACADHPVRYRHPTDAA